MAAEITRCLGVDVKFLTYSDAGVVADAVDEWDIGNIGAEPQRAKHITFTAAYCEIEATYLVLANTRQSKSRPPRQPHRGQRHSSLWPLAEIPHQARRSFSDQ